MSYVLFLWVILLCFVHKEQCTNVVMTWCYQQDCLSVSVNRYFITSQYGCVEIGTLPDWSGAMTNLPLIYTTNPTGGPWLKWSSVECTLSAIKWPLAFVDHFTGTRWSLTTQTLSDKCTKVTLKVVDSTEHWSKLTLVATPGKMIEYIGNFILPGNPIHFLSSNNRD